MIPLRESAIDKTIEIASLPSKDFIIDFEHGRIAAPSSGLEAVRQAAAMRLMTRGGAYKIYDNDYGLPSFDMSTPSAPLVYVDIKNSIVKTLTADDRFDSVYNFIFNIKDGGIYVSYNAKTSDGILKGDAVI